jgi:hypothetical protein
VDAKRFVAREIGGRRSFGFHDPRNRRDTETGSKDLCPVPLRTRAGRDKLTGASRYSRLSHLSRALKVNG